MKIRAGELEGWTLSWAVGKAEGDRVFRMGLGRPDDWALADYEAGKDDRWIVRSQVPNVGWFADGPYNPHQNWLYGGPIIDREHTEFDYDEATQLYTAADGTHAMQGKTHLIAAMRCYAASKLGDEVDIPKELLHNAQAHRP